MTAAELAASARPVLDRLYRDEIDKLGMLFATREAQGRATTDIAQAARAATMGAIDTCLVDIDESIPGDIDDSDGKVTFRDELATRGHDVVDEIARRVIMTRGRVLGVRNADIPDGKPLAASSAMPCKSVLWRSSSLCTYLLSSKTISSKRWFDSGFFADGPATSKT